MKSDKGLFFLKPAVQILLIAICGVAAYSNTFAVPFHFDDQPNILRNPLIQHFDLLLHPSQYCSQVDPATVQYTPCYSFQSRILGYLSFAMNFYLNGLHVAGYHIVNLLIHLVNGILVYSFVLLTLRTGAAERPGFRNVQLISLFSALLFTGHPVQTQAVTYIVQRFTSLATLFYLLSLIFYIQWRQLHRDNRTNLQNTENETISQAKTAFYYLMSLVSAVCAMKTKEIAFTLPVILACYEFIFFEGERKKRVLSLIPFFATMTIIPLSIMDLYKPGVAVLDNVSETMRVMTPLSRLDYLFTELRVIVTYIRLIFLPVNQNLDYDYPIYHSFFNIEVLGSFLLIAFICAAAIYLLVRSKKENYLLRLVSFGILWFFITLAVESSIIPIVDVIYEHRIYLPSIGAFISMVACLFYVLNRYLARREKIQRALLVSLVAITLILPVMSYKRNLVWQDEISLWRDVVTKSPLKARGHTNLGNAYYRMGLLDNAILEYQTALSLDPSLEDAVYNLSVALGMRNALNRMRGR